MLILLVEDEPDVRAFFERALKYCVPGATVIPVADVVEALDVFASSSLDLIVSDYHLPGMSGLDLIHAVRARSALPIIIISADRTIADEAVAAGATCFLSKPISLAALRSTVNQMCLLS